MRDIIQFSSYSLLDYLCVALHSTPNRLQEPLEYQRAAFKILFLTILPLFVFWEYGDRFQRIVLRTVRYTFCYLTIYILGRGIRLLYWVGGKRPNILVLCIFGKLEYYET